MGIGRVLGAAAPIAAGYFTGGAGFGLGAQIAAGAATGAGIAALSGQDMLGGAFTGGLGGMGGGSLAGAAGKTAAGAGATTTAEANKLAMSGGLGSGTQAAAGTYNPALNAMTSPIAEGAATFAGSPALQTGFQATAPMAQGPNMGFVGQSQKIAGGGGYNPSAIGRGVDAAKASFRDPGAFLENLGDGSKAMGAGKLGIMGLGVAGQAGAFDPDMPEYGDDPMSKYDPKRRLNLGAIDTGLKLNRDTGLRLLAEGGAIKNYQRGGEAEYTPGQLTKLEAYGVVPQYSPGMYGIINPIAASRKPITGIVDVGGKFVADPKGDITDVEYTDKFKYILDDKTSAEKNQEGGGDMDSINKAAGAGKPSTGAIAALAQGFARQQTQGPTESQTLGLQSLEAGGYLETGGEVGDGMSDEIEATIEGTQEARLSDGEFVIPADVVSHLGNGSSDAGARRLYEMMDKVRMARTGNKKQGKEIEPERYMPR
jgi:hypothetical protein